MVKRTVDRISSPSPFYGVLLIFCMILFPAMPHAKISGQAGELGEHQVRAAVETWARYLTADARPDAVIERMEPHKVNRETVAYIAHLKGGGFALCGADELLLPVYFYSPQGTYDPQNQHYQYILWEIATRLKNLEQAKDKEDPQLQLYQNALSGRAVFWQQLIARRVPSRMERSSNPLSEPISMALDLTSRWHQRSPYNDRCPELTPGADEHAVVGCVATAMAQIMFYWKWPDVGLGKNDVDYDYRWRSAWDEELLANDPQIPWGSPWMNRLEWKAVGGRLLRMNGYWDKTFYEGAQRISADPDYLDALENLWDRLIRASTNHYVNFGAAHYDWNMMQDTHTDPPDAGDAEAATLSFHAGVAVDMDYGVASSGAYVGDVDDALEDHFRYDSDAYDSARDIEEMTQEIQWLRPVALSGFTETVKINLRGKEGHLWVAFGYNAATDPNRQFLMNMGWGGVTGWYSVDDVFPLDQSHVTQIAPADVVKFVGDDDRGDGSPDDPYQDIEEAIAEAPDGATLIFKAGSVNTFSASALTIDRPIILRGWDITIRTD